MKRTIILRGPQQIDHACATIRALPDSPVHEVVIREHRRDRSLSQNALYWSWLTVIGNDLGMTKDELHAEYRRRFLVPILEHDDPEGFGAMVRAVRDLAVNGGKDVAKIMADQIVELTSTSRANVKQMTEYLDHIDRHAAGLGILLPRPEDYAYAMGRQG